MYTTNYTQQPAYRAGYQPQFWGIKGRPVASLDEARGSIIDFDGSIFYFPDLANKKIYTKQISVDGSVILNVYELSAAPIEQEKFITREEFEKALEGLRAALTPAPIATETKKAAVETTTVKPQLNLNF